MMINPTGILYYKLSTNISCSLMSSLKELVENVGICSSELQSVAILNQLLSSCDQNKVELVWVIFYGLNHLQLHVSSAVILFMSSWSVLLSHLSRSHGHFEFRKSF